jgi:hypothetical protein
MIQSRSEANLSTAADVDIMLYIYLAFIEAKSKIVQVLLCQNNLEAVFSVRRNFNGYHYYSPDVIHQS